MAIDDANHSKKRRGRSFERAPGVVALHCLWWSGSLLACYVLRFQSKLRCGACSIRSPQSAGRLPRTFRRVSDWCTEPTTSGDPEGQGQYAPILFPADQVPNGVINNELGMDELERRARLIREDGPFRERVGKALVGHTPDRPPSQHVELQIFDRFPSWADERIMAEFA